VFSEAEERFVEGQRVAHLATADAGGRPHVVPVCFVYMDGGFYTPIDEKPKRSKRLKRLRNIEENPQAALLFDEYDEEWSRLGYVLVRGTASMVEGDPEHERAVAALGSLEDERQRLAGRLAGDERGLAEAESALANARVELAARRSSLEALGELERAREGYGAGVRAVFSRGREAGLGGMVGTVADLLDVPAGLDRAIEAVLGERLQWVVVERFEHARAAVGYLHDHALGAATFLPLEHLPARGELPPDEGGVRWAARSVRGPAEPLVDHLLGQVAIVEHLDEAEALWRRNGVVATYVTPAGEVLGPTGRLHGGAAAASGMEHSLLARKRRLRELEGEVARLAARVEERQAAGAALAASVGALRERLGGLGVSVQARQADRLAGDKDLEQVAREHERVRRHRETLETEARQVAGEAEETATTLAGLERRIGLAAEAEARQSAAAQAPAGRVSSR